MAQADVISLIELEDIVRALHPTGLELIGSKEWYRKMSMFEELNIQAAVEAERGGEENVRQFLVEAKKMALIVHELLTTELWRENLLPRILDLGKPHSSFQIYMVLFNEANLINLLETVMFSNEACEALDDSVLDLTDYCIRNLSILISDLQREPEVSRNPDSLTAGDLSKQMAEWKPGMDLPNLPVEDVMDEIKRYQRIFHFKFLSDFVEDLPLGVSTRLVVTHDVPVLLSQIIEIKPWIKDSKVFEGTGWRSTPEDSLDLPKMEVQVWITIYNILSKKLLTDKYQINSYRRGVLVKLLEHLSDHHLNQLPILPAFKKWLLQVSISSAPSSGQLKPNFLIETVAHIRENLIQRYDGQWERLAEEKAQVFLGDHVADMADEVNRLFKAFDSEAAQAILSVGSEMKKPEAKPECAVCSMASPKMRCSRCHIVRYCGRDCQVKHWPEHKKKCKEN